MYASHHARRLLAAFENRLELVEVFLQARTDHGAQKWPEQAHPALRLQLDCYRHLHDKVEADQKSIEHSGQIGSFDALALAVLNASTTETRTPADGNPTLQ